LYYIQGQNFKEDNRLYAVEIMPSMFLISYQNFHNVSYLFIHFVFPSAEQPTGKRCLECLMAEALLMILRNF